MKLLSTPHQVNLVHKPLSFPSVAAVVMMFNQGLSILLVVGAGLSWLGPTKSHPFPLRPHPNAFQPAVDAAESKDQRIRVCGHRIRELVRLACPQFQAQGYYTPRGNHIQRRNSLPAFLFDENFEGRRLRRQIVRECCKQPCFKADLRKYCNAFRHPQHYEPLETFEDNESSISDFQTTEDTKMPFTLEIGALEQSSDVSNGGNFNGRFSASHSNNLPKKRRRKERSIQSNESNGGRGQGHGERRSRGHGMEVRTAPPQPEPVILHTSDFTVYNYN